MNTDQASSLAGLAASAALLLGQYAGPNQQQIREVANPIAAIAIGILGYVTNRKDGQNPTVGGWSGSNPPRSISTWPIQLAHLNPYREWKIQTVWMST